MTSVRPSPVFLTIVAVAAASGGYVWRADSATRPVRLVLFVFVMAVWVISLCLHEFAHAALAWRFGDDEVEARGYLTLNPLKYSHPLLSIVLPVVFIAMGGIGLPGGAVYVHPGRFRTRAQRAAVSLSGPMVNAVLGILVLVVVARSWRVDHPHQIFWAAMAFLGLLQIMAALLNLIPFPGLDGYGAIEPYLDPQFQRSAEQFKAYGMLALFALLQVQSLNRAFFDLVYRIYDLSGLPEILAGAGFELIKFWRPG